MDVVDFRDDYISNIEADSIERVLHPEKIFIEDVSDILKDDYARINNVLDYDCYIPLTIGTKKYKGMKLDAASIDIVTNTLNLCVCDYNNGECKTINMENVNTMAQKMRAFVENVIKGYYNEGQFEESQPIFELAHEFYRHRKDINKIQMFYISTNKLGNSVKSLKQAPISCLGDEFSVEYIVIAIEQIYQTKLPDFQKEDIVIDLDDYGVEIPCIQADINATDYDSYLAIVPGKFLADIYNKFQSRLLEDNVRSFLNVRGAVNKGIRGTILNEKDRFFTYNNGISTTAKEVEISNNPGKGMTIRKLIGFQIINGGQTTASLAHAMIKDKADLDGIYVQMKLTKTKKVDQDFVRLISKYANSQNKVTNADLSSNHPFYQRIEDFSHGAQKISAPPVDGAVNRTIWFFERVRGQYDQVKMKMTKSEIKTYERTHPKSQKFTKTDLAKYVNTFDMLPHYVSCGADVNATRFNDIIDKQWKKDNTIFNIEYFKELIAKNIMFKHVEKLISNEDWYIENKAYRAQLVTYTLAKFMHCVDNENLCMNYKKIWDMQAVPKEFDADLKLIAKMMFDIIHDNNRSIENIGEYCKREKCWDVAKNKKYNLTNDTINLLLTKEDVKIEAKRAKKKQIFNNGLDLEVQIFTLGAEFWHVICEKGLAQGVIDQYDADILNLAEEYCINDNIKFISNKQAKEIAQVMEKLEECGINENNAMADNR